MKFAFLDCETTGLDCSTHEIIQLSIIIEDNGKPIGIFNENTKPNFPERISPQAIEKQNRTIEEICEWQDRESFFNKLISFLDTHVDKFDKNDKLMLVGYKILFDKGFLEKLFIENNHKYFGSYFQHDILDVHAIALLFKLTGVMQFDNLKLEYVCEKFNIPFGQGEAHDSLFDIRKTRQLFYLMEKCINIDLSQLN